MKEPTYTYAEPSKEEAEIFNKGLEALTADSGIVLCPIPFIKDGKIDAQIQIYKKVELVPKESGVPSPYENGGNDSDKTASAGETA